jgi:hypothetical protein
LENSSDGNIINYKEKLGLINDMRDPSLSNICCFQCPKHAQVLTSSLKIRSPETVRTEGSNNNNGVCFPKNLSYPAALSFAQNYNGKQALKVEQFQFN